MLRATHQPLLLLHLPHRRAARRPGNRPATSWLVVRSPGRGRARDRTATRRRRRPGHRAARRPLPGAGRGERQLLSAAHRTLLRRLSRLPVRPQPGAAAVGAGPDRRGIRDWPAQRRLGRRGGRLQRRASDRAGAHLAPIPRRERPRHRRAQQPAALRRRELRAVRGTPAVERQATPREARRLAARHTERSRSRPAVRGHLRQAARVDRRRGAARLRDRRRRRRPAQSGLDARLPSRQSVLRVGDRLPALAGRPRPVGVRRPLRGRSDLRSGHQDPAGHRVPRVASRGLAHLASRAPGVRARRSSALAYSLGGSSSSAPSEDRGAMWRDSICVRNRTASG